MMQTPWGYGFTCNTQLGGLITAEEFAAYTGGKYAGDVRIEPNINAASAAIRNFCGWHIYPARECEFRTTFFDKRVVQVAHGLMIQLPARFVTGIASISIGGETVETYVLEPDGILRVYGALGAYEPWTAIVVKYTAGLPDEMMDAIKELAAHRATHALANSYGIQSESTGGISITYSANWSNSARATALADDNKEVLIPYRVVGVL